MTYLTANEFISKVNENHRTSLLSNLARFWPVLKATAVTPGWPVYEYEYGAAHCLANAGLVQLIQTDDGNFIRPIGE